MAKYCDEIIDKIVNLIEEDNYTTTQICEIVGISRKVFYEWRNYKPEFRQALKDAAEVREEKIRILARKALKRKLEGYKKIETKRVYVPDKNSDDPDKLVLKEYIVKEKHCEPDATIINHILTEEKKSRRQRDEENRRLPTPFVIEVTDQRAKEQLELLERNLRGRNITVTPDEDD